MIIRLLLYLGIAQLVEPLPYKQVVGGSSPSPKTITSEVYSARVTQGHEELESNQPKYFWLGSSVG